MKDYKTETNISARVPQQLELDLTVSASTEVAQYQDSSRFGYFSILTRDASGRAYQHSYTLDKLPFVLAEDGTLSKYFSGCKNDVYVSQATFESPCRRVVNLKDIQVAFLDIDSYKLAWGQHRRPEEIAQSFLSLCDAESIPRPSVIVFSGRGLQAKWLFERPVPRMALPRWNAVEKVLVEKMQQYGADSQARDASRVLRLVNTFNTKSGQKCRVVFLNRNAGGGIERYGFDELADIILPLDRPQRPQKSPVNANKSKTKRPIGFGLETLHWAFLEDLRTLLRIRGGIEEGMRNRFLMQMLSYLALSNQVTLKDFYREAQFLAQKIDPTWTYHSKDFGTVYEKFKAHMKGIRVEWNGQEKTPLYTPKAETLIEWFQITEEEQRQLKVIHSKELRRELDTERKRRERGGGSMQNYKERRAQSREFNTESVKALSEKGFSIRRIAEQLGISKTHVQRLLRGVP
ncbi:replication protein [Parasutterella sp.]|uniref:replication protein n=1 Tax=Parasutterella sp. TaxID=2049037 RepID=UPI003991D839